MRVIWLRGSERGSNSQNSGGMIRNYNSRSCYEIFFDRDSLMRGAKAIN
jgi:hypothetical protein